MNQVCENMKPPIHSWIEQEQSSERACDCCNDDVRREMPLVCVEKLKIKKNPEAFLPCIF